MKRKRVAVTFHLLVCLTVVEVSAWRLDSWRFKKRQFWYCCCPWGMSYRAGLHLRHQDLSFCFNCLTGVCNTDLPLYSTSSVIAWWANPGWRLKICWVFLGVILWGISCVLALACICHKCSSWTFFFISLGCFPDVALKHCSPNISSHHYLIYYFPVPEELI